MSSTNNNELTVPLMHSFDCEEVLIEGYPCICGAVKKLEAHTEQRVLEARIEENKKAKTYIGDLHMERVGRIEMDATIEIRESERRFFNSMLDSRIKQLQQSTKPRREE